VEEELDLQFGFFTTSQTGGNIARRAFHERVMAASKINTGTVGAPRGLLYCEWRPQSSESHPGKR